MVDEMPIDELLSKPPPGGIYVINQRTELTKRLNRDRELYYPILTAPLAGKGPMQMVCPDAHIDMARSFLGDCRKFLIIGCSGKDDDLLSLLSESIDIPSTETFALHVVGDQQVKEAYRNFLRGIPQWSGRTYLDGPPAFPMGF